MDVTTIYIICTMWGIGGVLILFVALWLAHQNSTVLANMPCPECRHLFGKKAVKTAIHKAQEEAGKFNSRIACEVNIFSKEFFARHAFIWPVECPACGIKCRYYPFEPLLHKGDKIKRCVFPLLEETESSKKTAQSKL